jgi:hypothetical protein
MRIRMARIDTACVNGTYRVAVSGSLTVRDLARFERACGRALEHEHPPLVVQLHRVTSVDDAAHIFLSNLARRGVAITTG